LWWSRYGILRLLKLEDSEESRKLTCAALTSGQFIRSDGVALYCCAQRPSAEFEKKRLLTKNLTSPESFLKSSSTKRELKDLLDRGAFGEDCKGCYERESLGFRSHRQRLNEKWGEAEAGEDLVFLNLELGNKCNFKCVYCSPTWSSSWNSEAHILEDFNIYEGRPISNDWLNNPDILNWLIDKIKDSSSFRSIEFAGGEPFLSSIHDGFLERLIQEELAGKIELIYSTNFSQITDPQIELLRKFKRVELLPSLDSFCEERFNYIRFPGSLLTVEKQFQKLKEYNFVIRPVLTLSVLNISEVSSNIRKCREVFECSPSFGFVHYPTFLHVSVLPNNEKLKVLDSLESIDHARKLELISQINRPFIEERFSELHRYLKALDSSRSLDHSKIFRELI
jgi:organic radical activating enzyme